jgi:mannose-1-phosphate guanylyltransferase
MERAQDVWVVPADIGWSDVEAGGRSASSDADAHGNVVIEGTTQHRYRRLLHP